MDQENLFSQPSSKKGENHEDLYGNSQEMCINYEIVETRNPTSNAVTSPSQLAFTE